MTYRIGKRFQFSASHRIEGLPPEHKCSRLHGHTYDVEIELAAEDLDEVGFVVDYGLLSDLLSPLLRVVDHRDLNEVFGGLPTTAESIARWFFDRLALVSKLAAVRVSETPSTWAEYRP